MNLSFCPILDRFAEYTHFVIRNLALILVVGFHMFEPDFHSRSSRGISYFLTK